METTVSRIEQFRQLRAEVRGSGRHLIVGVDVSKQRHHAFMGTATGKGLLRRLVFDNARAGFDSLLMRIEAVRVRHGLEQAVVGMEPTANYHKPLMEVLVEAGHMVVLVSTVAVKHNRRLLDGRWDKNDTKDAANIADLVSQGKCQYVDVPSDEIGQLRCLLSLRNKLGREAHAMQMRIRNHLLAQYFPELDGYAQRSMRLVRPVLQWSAVPATIAGMDVDDFVSQVMPQAKPRQRQHLVAIWHKAQQSIGCGAGPAVQHEASVVMRNLQTLREAISETETKIAQLCRRSPHYAHLQTIPGFGPVVSAVVIGAIGDPWRFRSAQQVIKLAGLDLSASRSGKQSDKAQPHISKAGKSPLRYALVQAALVASAFSPPIMAYYTARLDGRQREPGIKTKMRVKLAAKLLVIAWTLMKTQQPFDSARLQGEVPPVSPG